ncbi:MAG: (2Fe-2S) ferredoxin domain-containing protein [Synechococcaceae cyanobacterium]|nr:(2Fe-2S) ferredoxin domain-containing protein [Synechococcaceae cyanobacterium]
MTPPPAGAGPQAAGREGPRVQHHLLLCAAPSKPLCCNDPLRGAACWQRLKALVRDLGLEDPRRPEGVVWRSKVDCLRVCSGGPVLLIWPEGIVYGELTPERLERIVRQHILQGQPIDAWVVRRVPLAGSAAELSRGERPPGPDNAATPAG